ncbi:hypothetical protein CGLO_13921 [Colletotrichum gloeosporioides Cg-14]|uniref:Uncharacterized protein n=1 Tax=Colletotrichum gloeosporioides (strain Cg-14) TaxID=1237896 RepID=T0K502_COLGC|nr:hypothetical protein CGLO_13921 [Colletotrichum gloeosporioides Cg-14]
MPHNQVLKAIELFGKEVAPKADQENRLDRPFLMLKDQ